MLTIRKQKKTYKLSKRNKETKIFRSIELKLFLSNASDGSAAKVELNQPKELDSE